ncbi:MAG: hypothetical protein SGI71_06080 [Verrucomicrobiota bacterium]|nr:hypothetical protein [Verrucomicrobiota bacterium]
MALFNQERKVHKHWRKKQWQRVGKKFLSILFLLLVVGALFFIVSIVIRQTASINNKEVVEDNSPFVKIETDNAPLIKYNEEFQPEPKEAIFIKVESAEISKEGARCTIRVNMTIRNDLTQTIKVDTRTFDLLDSRGISYLRESGQNLMADEASKYLVQGKSEQKFDLSFFPRQDIIYQEVFLRVNGRKVLLKNVGKMKAQLLIGESATFSSPDW